MTRNTMHFFVVSVLLSILTLGSADATDSMELSELILQDQAARSAENMKREIVPTLQEERARRFAVMRLLVDGEIKTANDYMNAAVILHHTTKWQTKDGKYRSLGTENHIVAFHLAHRAHQLGHARGAHFLVWTYNYYLRAYGAEDEKYGYDLVDGKIVARNSNVLPEDRIAVVGFDPSKYFSGDAQPD